MKRSTLILLLVTGALAVLAAVLLLRNRSSNLRPELRDFAFVDTAAITKVFLADKNHKTLLLEKSASGTWTVNGKETARQNGINQLLTTLKMVSVRTRVPKTMYNFVVKDLASTGVKCEIYTDQPDQPAKVYYVGGPTQDMTGTYMMREGSGVPFILEIPGFNGYLTPRYSVEADDWRDKVVFSERSETITSIEVLYPATPQYSFRIERKNGKLDVYPAGSDKALVTDSSALINYIDFFKLLPFEDFDKAFGQLQRDSLAASTPLAVIRVNGSEGMKEAVLHHKPVTQRSLVQQDPKGNPVAYDVDRMYAFIRGGKELVIIQYFSFGKVLRKLSDFDASQRRKQG